MKDTFAIAIKWGLGGHPELDISGLLEQTGAVRLKGENGKSYVLKRTERGGLQLCAEVLGKEKGRQKA